jgi:SAM-dependent methyltransferase
MMSKRAFSEIEHTSWEKRAHYYNELFGDVTRQSIEPTLDRLGSLTGQSLLDIACGTGHLVAETNKRGAHCTGIDFSQSMLTIANQNYPEATFELADALNLPYKDASFDYVTCAFGLSHMEDPQAALNEVYRVLKPKGRFAFTLWYGADAGNQLKNIVSEAFKSLGAPAKTLPVSWTQLRNANPVECSALVRQAGFIHPTFKHLALVFRTDTAQKLVDFAEKLSVRTKLLLDQYTPDEQQRIYDHIMREAESRRADDGMISLNFPALLTVAQKPA